MLLLFIKVLKRFLSKVRSFDVMKSKTLGALVMGISVSAILSLGVVSCDNSVKYKKYGRERYANLALYSRAVIPAFLLLGYGAFREYKRR
jgi:ABC-type Na+ efflux pump permease subunit